MVGVEGWLGANVTIETVRDIFRAFSTGDIPVILTALAEDVRWLDIPKSGAAQHGVPWLVPCRGRDAVADFFKSMRGVMVLKELQVLSLMEGDRQVAAEILVHFETMSGYEFSDTEVHLWTFDEEGKVERFRHFVDTARHIEAWHATQAAMANPA